MFKEEMFEVVVNEPTKDFILSLDEDLKSRIYSLFDVLQLRGNQLKKPHSKALGGGLFELRIKGKDRLARLFYAFSIGKRIFILHGFIKKSQKTPKKELEIAFQRLKELENEVD